MNPEIILLGETLRQRLYLQKQQIQAGETPTDPVSVEEIRAGIDLLRGKRSATAQISKPKTPQLKGLDLQSLLDTNYGKEGG